MLFSLLHFLHGHKTFGFGILVYSKSFAKQEESKEMNSEDDSSNDNINITKRTKTKKQTNKDQVRKKESTIAQKHVKDTKKVGDTDTDTDSEIEQLNEKNKNKGDTSNDDDEDNGEDGHVIKYNETEKGISVSEKEDRVLYYQQVKHNKRQRRHRRAVLNTNRALAQKWKRTENNNQIRSISQRKHDDVIVKAWRIDLKEATDKLLIYSGFFLLVFV